MPSVNVHYDYSCWFLPSIREVFYLAFVGTQRSHTWRIRSKAEREPETCMTEMCLVHPEGATEIRAERTHYVLTRARRPYSQSGTARGTF
jgi:hypothetical protein